MSVDVQRLKDLMPNLHMIWSAPLQIVLSLIFLYLTMGPSIFAGFAVLVLMIPLNSCLASCSKKFQAKQMRQKDSRIRLVNEVLNGIKVTKSMLYKPCNLDKLNNNEYFTFFFLRLSNCMPGKFHSNVSFPVPGHGSYTNLRKLPI